MEQSADIKIQCRSCSKNCVGDGLDMTDSTTKVENFTILEAFTKCTRVHLSDSFPKYLCHLCFLRLKDAFAFIRQCQAANEKFAEYFEEPEVEVKNDPIVCEIEDNKLWLQQTSNDYQVEALELEEMHNDDDASRDDDNSMNESKFIPRIDFEGDQSDTVVPMPPIPQSSRANRNKWKGFLCPSPYCREYCGAKSTDLEKHLQKHHGDIDHMYTCDYCGVKFARRLLLFTHATQIHKSATCAICDVTVIGERKLDLHKKKMHSIDKEAVVCPHCGKTISSRRSLLKHMQTKHNIGGKQIVHDCKYCDRSFKTKTGLQYHERSAHTGERPYCCDVCGKSFIQPANLQCHMMTHTDEKPFQCDICSLKVKHAYTLKEHRLIHFTESNVKCPICDKKFKFEKYLQTHMLTHRNIKDVVCQICGHATQNLRNLRTHMRKHCEPTNQCPLCDKVYHRKTELKNHISATHEQDRMHTCSYPNCGKAYLRRPHLNHHVKTVHLNQQRLAATEATSQN